MTARTVKQVKRGKSLMDKNVQIGPCFLNTTNLKKTQ